MPLERPEPEPARLLAALDEWVAGEATPGATMQSLKRGVLDELVAASDNDELKQAWDEWERGRATPGDTLQRIEQAGVRALLQS